jgi:hypothetical protein
VNSPFRPKVDSANYVIQELPDELLLYNLSTNKVFALNRTSGFVWQNCDGEKTVREIAEALEVKLNENVPEELVWLTLERLQNSHLIEINEDTVVREIKVKRREILKKAGLATMAALPLVSSLTAPPAASAQSGIILQQCSVCLTKTHEFTTCANVCQDIIVGDCHDNSGCGQGIFLSLVTCGECLGGLPPNGNPSTISWHGTQYKNP